LFSIIYQASMLASGSKSVIVVKPNINNLLVTSMLNLLMNGWKRVSEYWYDRVMLAVCCFIMIYIRSISSTFQAPDIISSKLQHNLKFQVVYCCFGVAMESRVKTYWIKFSFSIDNQSTHLVTSGV